MGKPKRSNQRKEYDTMMLSRMVVRWEKSVFAKKRKWTELQPDILVRILQKMDSITILTKAMRLCRAWFAAARNDPSVWRKVDMTCYGSKFGPNYLEDMACVAVNWSAGRLEEFSAEEFGSEELLQYIVDSTSNLKRISLIECNDISSEALVKALKQWPLLEEIDLITSYYHWQDFVQTIIQSCPQLKCFRINKVYVEYPKWDRDEGNSIAECVARNLHGLRSLQFIGSRMMNEGLRAILQGCPQLESLDIRNCYQLNLDESIRGALEGIKHLRLPDEPTDDYKFARHAYTLVSEPCRSMCCWSWSYDCCYDNDSGSDDGTGDEFDCDTENCLDFMNYWKFGGKKDVFLDWKLRGKIGRGE